MNDRFAQCQFAQDSPDIDRCQNQATRKYGDYWFCETHGSRYRKKPASSDSHRPTRRWWDTDYPIIATINENMDLIAHPNGPAMCDGDYISSIDTHPDDPRDMMMLKMKAQAAWRKYSWPLLKANFYPETNDPVVQSASSRPVEERSNKSDQMSAKKAVSKNKQTRSSGSDSVPCSRFWVIMHETPGKHDRSRTAVGPFKSYHKAEKWIREDAHATFLATEDALAGDPKKWGEVMTIAEERRTLKPVPKVTVSITLQIHAENADVEVRR